MIPALVLSVGTVLALLFSGGRSSDDAPAAPAHSAPPEPAPQQNSAHWRAQVLAYVMGHESGSGSAAYSAANRNTDNAGLSHGIIQWSQKPGSLGKLLNAYYTENAVLFRQVFGPAHLELLATTQAGSSSLRLRPVAGAKLWESPWLERFHAAGQHGTFQYVQLTLALNGEYWLGAERVVDILGVPTFRAYVLAFDACIQQGPAAAGRIASRMMDGLRAQGRHPTPSERLLLYAQSCAEPFRMFTDEAPSDAWREVTPGEWHKYAGRIDLFANIRKRRLKIVKDSNLSDAVVG